MRPGAPFLSKPFMPESLLAFVAEALGEGSNAGHRPESPAAARRPRQA